MSRTLLTQEQFDDLLDYLDCTKRNGWKGDTQQFTCTVHNESTPSMGINLNIVTDKGKIIQAVHCFSCGFKGNIPNFLKHSMPDRFTTIKKAIEFLNNRYKTDFGYTIVKKSRYINRYEEQELKEARKIINKSFIAPFKSGKETYQYFFNRGFNKTDMQKFMIGRDLEEGTVTIPVFYEDNNLAGVVGRYISNKRPKNMRFKVYNFPKGSLLYPLNHLEIVDNTIICCEGFFCAINLHKWGFKNAVATMGDTLTSEQADIIVNKCKVFIDLFDNDKGGLFARKIAQQRLQNKVIYLTPTYYPKEGKDPSEWGYEETLKVIQSASIQGKKLDKII